MKLHAEFEVQLGRWTDRHLVVLDGTFRRDDEGCWTLPSIHITPTDTAKEIRA